jgi:hypothetical protein
MTSTCVPKTCFSNGMETVKPILCLTYSFLTLGACPQTSSFVFFSFPSGPFGKRTNNTTLGSRQPCIVHCNGWMIQCVYIEIVRVVDDCLNPIVVEGVISSGWGFRSFRPLHTHTWEGRRFDLSECFMRCVRLTFGHIG